MNFGQVANALGRGITFIVAFAQAMADQLQEWITAVAELQWDHMAIIRAGPMRISTFVGIALATTQTWIIVLGMTGAHGDPVQRHAAGALRHVQEPHGNALDRQSPPHHATQMTVQHSKVKEK